MRDYGDFASHPLWHKLLKLHEDNLKLKYERLKAVSVNDFSKCKTSHLGGSTKDSKKKTRGISAIHKNPKI